MKIINPNKVYQGSDPYLVELYVLGHEVEWFNKVEQLNEGYWIPIPSYDSDENSSGSVARVTNKDYKFRIKVKDHFVFFHTSEVITPSKDGCKNVEFTLFNYPEYYPSGPYTMYRVRNNEVIDSYSSMTRSIDDEFFR